MKKLKTYLVLKQHIWLQQENFFVEPDKRSGENICQWWLLRNLICFMQCGFFIEFYDLSARQRLDNVFYVLQNVPPNESCWHLVYLFYSF